MSEQSAICPDCESRIKLPPGSEIWMRITCPECGTLLEIANDDPWELDYAPDSAPDSLTEDDTVHDFDADED